MYLSVPDESHSHQKSQFKHHHSHQSSAASHFHRMSLSIGSRTCTAATLMENHQKPLNSVLLFISSSIHQCSSIVPASIGRCPPLFNCALCVSRTRQSYQASQKQSECKGESITGSSHELLQSLFISFPVSSTYTSLLGMVDAPPTSRAAPGPATTRPKPVRPVIRQNSLTIPL